jgi:plastocyanin
MLGKLMIPLTIALARGILAAHTFNIKRVSGGKVLFQSARLAPGKRITVTRTRAAGKYRLYCTIHAGMYKIFTAS